MRRENTVTFRLFLTAAAFFLTIFSLQAETADYTLENPLVFSDGRVVSDEVAWRQRRTEILDIFQKEMYGKMPPCPDTLIIDTFEEGTTLQGMAKRKQVRMWFTADRKGPHIDWLIVSPAFRTSPSPVIIMLNLEGNHTILKDEAIAVTDAWMRIREARGRLENHSIGTDRGILSGQESSTIIPLATIIARGYSYVTACYCEVSPDPGGEDKDYRKLQKTLAYTGVFDLWGPREKSKSDNPGSICAWAWALSRGIDLAEKIQTLDATRIVLTGCSRLGKAALLAGAFDERVGVTIPVQTGCGGATLSKRAAGETVAITTKAFPHWYCKEFIKYAGNEKRMPFDQHLLLSCVAPRGLLVEGFDAPWFDTEGEFLSVKAASPVWEFLGKSGIPAGEWPSDFDESAIGPNLGYIRRPGVHGFNGYDWMWLLNFTDRYFSL